VQIRPVTQPLFRLQWQSQDIAFTHEELIERMLRYVDADPVCLRHPQSHFNKRVRSSSFCGYTCMHTCWFHWWQLAGRGHVREFWPPPPMSL
jgi:hypothetical protein